MVDRAARVTLLLPALVLCASAAFAGPQAAAPASTPRTADGKPDLSGIWQTMTSAAWNVEDHTASPGVPAGQGVVDGGAIPYLPAAPAKRIDNFAHRATADPEGKCYLLGVPRIIYAGFPFQIVQTRDQLTMLFEWAHATRYLYTNGSAHPPGHIDWWMGDSRGRWDGDTLVVDVTDFSEDTWLDRAGNYHSPQLHVIEHWKFLDANTIEYQATLEDPQVFSRPWNISVLLYRHREKN